MKVPFSKFSKASERSFCRFIRNKCSFCRVRDIGRADWTVCLGRGWSSASKQGKNISRRLIGRKEWFGGGAREEGTQKPTHRWLVVKFFGFLSLGPISNQYGFTNMEAACFQRTAPIISSLWGAAAHLLLVAFWPSILVNDKSVPSLWITWSWLKVKPSLSFSSPFVSLQSQACMCIHIHMLMSIYILEHTHTNPQCSPKVLTRCHF